MRDYKNIKAYQLAEELVFEVYRAAKGLPKEEMYGLASQIKRAVVSIPANIAEGASRNHKRDYLQFLYVARGSAAETECLLGLAVKLGYLSVNDHAKLSSKREEAARTLFGLINSVEKEIKSE
jgi:four helix bundle protein